MSETLYEENGVAVTRMAGPASEGPDRTRYHLTLPSNQDLVVLKRQEALVGVAMAIINDQVQGKEPVRAPRKYRYSRRQIATELLNRGRYEGNAGEVARWIGHVCDDLMEKA